jgi:hypothetical protein
MKHNGIPVNVRMGRIPITFNYDQMIDDTSLTKAKPEVKSDETSFHNLSTDSTKHVFGKKVYLKVN